MKCLLSSAPRSNAFALTITGTAAPVANSGGQLVLGVWLNGATISSTGTGNVGAITLNGTGTSDGLASGAYNDGIIFNSTTISSSDANIAITGTGRSDSSGYYNVGVLFNTGTSAVKSTGKGTITITGSGENGDDGIQFSSYLSGLTSLGSATDTGNISLIADSIMADSSLTSIQTAGTVTIQPKTTGTAVNFANGTSGLAITQAIMDDVDAPTVIVGSLTGTGTLTTGAFNWEHTLTTLNLEEGGAGGSITKGVDDGLVVNSGTANLNVISGTDISNNAALTISSSGSYGALNTIFDANYAGGGGAIVFGNYGSPLGISIASNGGNIVLTGGNNPGGIYSNTLPATGAVGDNVASALSDGVFLWGSTFTSGAGNIIVYGSGTTGSTGACDDGVSLEGSTSLSTTTGNITLTGFGSTSPGSAVWGHDIGVMVIQSSQLSTVSGAIDITGTGYGTSGDVLDHGVVITGSVTSTSTGSGVGNITITGTGAVLGEGAGVEVLAGADISSADANINITGTAPSTTSHVGNNGINIGVQNDAGIQGSTTTGATIASTGKGNITLTATGGAGAADMGNLYGGAPPSNVSTIGNAAGTGTISFVANTLLDPLDIQVQTSGQAGRTHNEPLEI